MPLPESCTLGTVRHRVKIMILKNLFHLLRYDTEVNLPMLASITLIMVCLLVCVRLNVAALIARLHREAERKRQGVTHVGRTLDTLFDIVFAF